MRRSPELTVSVALCTFNGAKHLLEQLESISHQSRPPEEVIVCDDRSEDNTVEIVSSWAESIGLPVHMYVNPKRLGPIKNFERAVALCGGNLIALADQDDVWHPLKLQRSVDLLAERPSVGMVFTDANVVDGRLRPLGYRMWQTRRFRSAEQRLIREGRALQVLIRRNVVTGATMVFRSRFRELVLPIPENHTHFHDGWIAFLTAGVSDIDFLDEPLMDYRQSAGQVIGAHPPTGLRMLARAAAHNSLASNSEALIATVEWHRHLSARLMDKRTEYPHEDSVQALLQSKIQHTQRRINMPRAKGARTLAVIREFASLGYHRYSIGVWAAAKDLAS